jgi:hypothetical protein
MRRPAKDLDLALRLNSEGMSATSIARAIGVHMSTVGATCAPPADNGFTDAIEITLLPCRRDAAPR